MTQLAHKSIALLAIGASTLSMVAATVPARAAAPITASVSTGRSGQPAAASAASTRARAAATNPVSQFTAPVYQANNDDKGASFLSRWAPEVAGAVKTYGFTHDMGVAFDAAAAPTDGAVAVHRLWKASAGFLYILEQTPDNEMANAISKYGFTDEGVSFYAATDPGAGLVGVYRLQSPQGRRWYTTDKSDRDAKVAAGWGEGFVAFYVRPATTTTTTTPTSPLNGRVDGYAHTPRLAADINPAGDADGRFSIAVLPDTQEETSSAGLWQKSSAGLDNTVNWIVNHKASDDIRFVASSGDLNNWSERMPAQMDLTKTYLDKLNADGLPFALAIGNHDSGAVGSNKPGDTTYGGSAYVDNPLCLKDPVIHSDAYLLAVADKLGYGTETCKTRVLVRQTDVTNKALPLDYLGDVTNTWEPNKLDNAWSEFSAGGKKFAVLTLEFCPRKDAVAWANQQVAAHPDTNVIVVTHSYLNDDGSIRSDAEYGETSGTMLADELVSKHSNIKAVFSGHVGEFASRTDTYNGNVVASFLETMHRTNPEAPIRTVAIDVKAGTITSRMVNGADDTTYANSQVTVSGVSFV